MTQALVPARRFRRAEHDRDHPDRAERSHRLRQRDARRPDGAADRRQHRRGRLLRDGARQEPDQPSPRWRSGSECRATAWTISPRPIARSPTRSRSVPDLPVAYLYLGLSALRAWSGRRGRHRVRALRQPGRGAAAAAYIDRSMQLLHAVPASEELRAYVADGIADQAAWAGEVTDAWNAASYAGRLVATTPASTTSCAAVAAANRLRKRFPKPREDSAATGTPGRPTSIHSVTGVL